MSDPLIRRLRGDNDEALCAALDAADRIEQQDDRIAQLAEALKGLHDDNVDYLRLNHLGGYDNHWLKSARAALARLESQYPDGGRVKDEVGRCDCGASYYDEKHIGLPCQIQYCRGVVKSVPQKGVEDGV